MATLTVSAISLFGALIIFLRSLTGDIGGMEEQAGYMFLYILIISLILAPVFLYLSVRLEKYKRRTERV